MDMHMGGDRREPMKGKMHEMPSRGQKGGAMDHKAAVSKMHPQHVHQLVQDAHAGKFGPDAQKTAQMAMQPQAPMGDQDGDQQQEQGPPPAGRMNSIFGGGRQAPPTAPASKASIF